MPKCKVDVQPAVAKEPLVEQSLRVATYCRSVPIVKSNSEVWKPKRSFIPTTS